MIERSPAAALTSTVEFSTWALTVFSSVLKPSTPAPATAMPAVPPTPKAIDPAQTVEAITSLLSAVSRMSPVVAVTPLSALMIETSIVLWTKDSARPTPIDIEAPTPPNAAATATAPVHADTTEVSLAVSTTSAASMPVLPSPSIVASTSVATLLRTRAPAPPRLPPPRLPPDAATEPANADASIVTVLVADCVRLPTAAMLELVTVDRTSAGVSSPEAVKPIRFCVSEAPIAAPPPAVDPAPTPIAAEMTAAVIMGCETWSTPPSRVIKKRLCLWPSFLSVSCQALPAARVTTWMSPLASFWSLVNAARSSVS